MTSAGRTNDLGDFLKARRGEVNPEQVGLLADPDTSRRRVRGLRREEVAALASISTDYYARIEQGRRSAPRATLEAIARVLLLDDDGRDYLFSLAERESGAVAEESGEQRVSVHLRRLLADLSGIPAIVLGRRMHILAWNPLAAALYMDFSKTPESERNYVRLMFVDPRMRTLNGSWDESARECVAQLHMEVARDPSDTQLATLVGELSMRDKDFGRWWSDHRVAARSRGVKDFRHPSVGDMTLDWQTLRCVDDPDQQVIFWTATPGTRSDARMRQLARMTDSSADTRERSDDPAGVTG